MSNFSADTNSPENDHEKSKIEGFNNFLVNDKNNDNNSPRKEETEILTTPKKHTHTILSSNGAVNIAVKVPSPTSNSDLSSYFYDSNGFGGGERNE